MNNKISRIAGIFSVSLMLLSSLALVTSCKDDDSDFSAYMTSKTIYIQYDGSSASVTGDESGIVSISGADVTINSQIADSLIIEVSGSTSDGSLLIFRQEARKFRLRLNGVSITNADGPAINNQCGKALYLEVIDGSTNTLTDGTSYTEQSFQQKGTLFSEGQIIFSGTGELTVNGNCKNAIACDDYIVVDGGVAINTVTYSTGSNGIKVNDGFYMKDGTLNIDVQSAAGRGIKCDSVTVFSGGTTTISTSGDCVAETVDGVTDYSSAACVKSAGQVLMSGGTLTMTSTGDGGKGINCDADVTVTGGTLTAKTTGTKNNAKPKAVKGDGGIILSGGVFTATVNYGWACDNGTDSDDPADRVTINGTPLTQTLEKQSVSVQFEEDTSTTIRTIYLAYNGSSVTVTGDDDGYVTTDGADVTLDAGTNEDSLLVVLSGSTSDGSLLVYRAKRYGIKLNGVSITNSDGPAINNQCSKSLFLTCASGTTNTLADGTSYTERDDIQQKGTLFSEGQISFLGSGTLNVTANCKNAIACDDYIVVSSEGTITTKTNSTGSNGIKANDGITINSGTLNIDVESDGGRGIRSESTTTINGGSVTITTSGDCVEEIVDGVVDYTSAAGIKSDGLFSMTGGILTITSDGDGGKGIRCAANVEFSGGTLNITTTGDNTDAKPKGIKSDTGIIVSGGDFTVNVSKSWACDNGYGDDTTSDAEKLANCITVNGSPTTKTIEKKQVIIKY